MTMRKPFPLAALLTVATLATLLGLSAARDAEAASVTISPHWQVGFGGWNRSSSPLIADIDNNGSNEVIVGHQDGTLRVFNANGTNKWSAAARPGTPPGCHTQTSASAIDSSPVAADLDGNGTLEIIVGVGSTWRSNQNGGVVVFNANGSTRWNWAGTRDMGNVWANSPNKDGWCEGVFSTPAVGDVDGDGHLDIVFGAWDLRIYALDRNGNMLAGFPIEADDSVWSSPALTDIDGDGDAEIFIGGDSSPGGEIDNRGGVFWALDVVDGRVVELWRKLPQEVIQSSPSIGDIDGDGRAEVIVSTGETWKILCQGNYPGCAGFVPRDHVKVWAWHVDDGSALPGFPVSAGGTVVAAPALGDVDGDGLDEVVVGSHDSKVYAWNGNGSLAWSVTPQFAHFGAQRMIGNPIIADLDGDGDQDVAVPSAAGVAILNGHNGSQIDGSWSWPDRPGFAWSYESAPAVGVLDGQRRLVMSGFNTPENNSMLASWTLPGSAATVDDWPMFGYSPDRIGARSNDICALLSGDGDFCDVRAGAWFAGAVSWLVDEGITSGVTPTKFAPNGLLTRGQMVTFLWRQAGSPTGYPATGFTDVPGSAFYAKAVAWAKAEGITGGLSATKFGPGALIPRNQMVVLLWRLAGQPNGSPSGGFSDVPSSSWYGQAVNWAAHEGITSGSTPTTFSPDSSVTRAQMAVFLYRAAGA